MRPLAEGTWERSAVSSIGSLSECTNAIPYTYIYIMSHYKSTNLNDSNLMLWLASIQTLAVGINFKYYCFVAMAD